MKSKTWIILGLAALLTTSTAVVQAADSIKLLVNGKEIKADVAPRIVEGRVMVPLRWVSEALGARDVHWDASKRQVSLSSKSGGGQIWEGEFEQELDSYFGVQAVNRYLVSLQSVIGGGYSFWEGAVTPDAIKNETVYMPMTGMTGSSVRSIPRFEILDGRQATDAQGNTFIEIAARYYLVDPTDDSPYQAITKAYRVETVQIDNALHTMVASERLLDLQILKDKPGYW